MCVCVHDWYVHLHVCLSHVSLLVCVCSCLHALTLCWHCVNLAYCSRSCDYLVAWEYPRICLFIHSITSVCACVCLTVYVNESVCSIKPYTCAIWPRNSLPCPPEWDGYVWLHHTHKHSHTCTHTHACSYLRQWIFLMVIETKVYLPLCWEISGDQSQIIFSELCVKS